MSKHHPLLIIDDDEEMCAELNEILTEEGYDVQMALDGYKGKEALEKGRYEAVILDLKLPGINGYEILQSARRHGCRSKIIVLSGRPMGNPALHPPQDYTQVQEEHILGLADAVMNKPVDISLLLGKLHTFVSSHN